MSKDRVLIIGGGGREHALGWKIRQSETVGRIYFAPGNAGTEEIGENIPLKVDEISKLLDFARRERIHLTIVGPELPLSLGIVDLFQENDLRIFGPTKQGARLETDKACAVEFMERHQIPHPQTWIFHNYAEVIAYAEFGNLPMSVIKASGLAEGKGVILPKNANEVYTAVDFLRSHYPEASQTILVQEKLTGHEVSFLAITDGKRFISLPPAQDHKKVFDHDEGPNTGGMGAVSPAPWMSDENLQEIQEKIIRPTISGLRDEGIIYRGVLYAGLMMSADGPKVLEYNVRFGDPETQPQMMLLNDDFYQTLKATAEGSLDERMLNIRQGSTCCVVLTSGGYPGNYEKGQLIHGLGQNYGSDIQVFQAGTVRFENGETVTNGGRVLGITSYGFNHSAAINKAYSIIGNHGVYFNNMHYRKDIGKKPNIK